MENENPKIYFYLQTLEFDLESADPIDGNIFDIHYNEDEAVKALKEFFERSKDFYDEKCMTMSKDGHHFEILTKDRRFVTKIKKTIHKKVYVVVKTEKYDAQYNHPLSSIEKVFENYEDAHSLFIKTLEDSLRITDELDYFKSPVAPHFEYNSGNVKTKVSLEQVVK